MSSSTVFSTNWLYSLWTSCQHHVDYISQFGLTILFCFTLCQFVPSFILIYYTELKPPVVSDVSISNFFLSHQVGVKNVVDSSAALKSDFSPGRYWYALVLACQVSKQLVAGGKQAAKKRPAGHPTLGSYYVPSYDTGTSATCTYLLSPKTYLAFLRTYCS